jgi:hypothetical protein
MRTLSNHQQYAERLSNNLTKWLSRKSRRLSQEQKFPTREISGVHVAEFAKIRAN